MGNKINVSELLKDCPKGMELDCVMYDNAYLEQVDEKAVYPIVIRIGKTDTICLTKEGHWNRFPNAKCVIFPKGKTTWEGFHRPFKDGDILVYKHKSNNVKYTFIYKRRIDMHYLLQYCGWFSEKPYLSEQFNAKERMPLYENDDIKFATEEEKQKLFDAIKANGYKWNAETKTLEKLIKPIFKVGDRIRRKTDTTTTKIIGYIYHDSYALYDGHLLLFKEQDQYELVPDKFDISKLKPFDKVLVRDFDSEVWDIDFFSKLLDGKHFKCHGSSYVQCIPYKGNEHLHNTTNACHPFYKTWEK